LITLDSLDNSILSSIQDEFPVCQRPFREIARSLCVDENVLIEKLRRLREHDIIRRFGAVFDSRKLGYFSTLVAVRIPNRDDLPAIARSVNQYPEVTHNYQRDDRFNLWFTLIASSPERIEKILARVAALDGVAQVQNLPAQELYKIRASFKPLVGKKRED
jgi:DNA-binding Lrp family transcriptional regulator